MHVESRMAGKPVAHRGRLVSAVVVHDQVDVQHRRHVGLDGAQELQELTSAVPAVRLADHLTGGDVQCREQGRRAVARVVMRTSGGDPRSQRQLRLRAVQRLNLALLVHAQHHRHQRRSHVKPHDVAHLVHEHRVGGQLEGLLAVRLQAKRPPDARHGRLRHSPASRAMMRVLQCVAPSGTDSSVLAITASTCASTIVRGAPVRGASSRPASRCSTYRARHLPTVCGVTRCRDATALLSWPSARARTLRARRASGWAV